MKRVPIFLQAVLAILLMIGLGPPGLAQSNRGSVSGSILDPSQAVISDAKISARNTQTGVITEVTSTGDGNYRLELPVGIYDLTVTAQGFKTGERTGVRIEVNTVTALDIALEAGAVTDTVTVSADAPTVQSESSDIGTVVGTRQVLELPLLVNGVGGLRSPEAFVFLTPGAVGPGTATDAGVRNDGAGENGGAFQSKITGSQNFSNEVLLDGASVFRSENGSSFDETALSIEAVREFKVQTSTLPAEFGRTGGGITSFVVKSGTNDIHGDVYDFFRNRVLNANRFFNNARGIERPFDNHHNFGATIGGPVWIPKLYNGRDKTFWFFAYEGFRRNESAGLISTLPLAEFRAGNFSALLDPARSGNQRAGQVIGRDALGRDIRVGQIFDPSTTRTVNGQIVRDPFPNNVIPLSRFSQVARNVLEFIPPTSTNSRFDNFLFSGQNPIRANTFTVKGDHSISDNSKLSGSYSQRINERFTCIPSLPEPLAPGCQNQAFTTRYYRLMHDYTISSKVLNHFNVGFNRTVSDNRAPSAGTVDFASLLGISGVGPNLFPRFSFAEGITDIGNTTFNLNIDNGLRLNDSVSWVKGSHSLKFGGDFRYQQYTPTNQGSTSGRFNFRSGQTAAAPTLGGDTGFGFASFLLGTVNDAVVNISPNIVQWRSNYFALFMQDDFKVTRNFVLNLGLRWEVETPRRELHNRTSSFDPRVPNPGAGGLPGALVFANDDNRGFADTWYKDFGPRIGFAWSPDRSEGIFGRLLGGAGKTVIRGGYGIYYQALVYADFGERLVAGFGGEVPRSSPNGFDPAFNIDQGFPQDFPRPPFLDPTIRNGQDIEFVAPGHGRPPMIQNWSLEVQRELAKDLILNVAYVGANGHHLRSQIENVNTLRPEFLRLGNLLFADINSPEARAAGIRRPFPTFNGSVFQALRPFPQYNTINTDCCLENSGNMSYNSLQVKLERRFRQGLNLLTSYTFSKTLTDADSALPIFATFSGGGSAQNPYDRRGEKSISNQDIPHALVVSYIYELPFGEGKPVEGGRVVNSIIGGWQVGGVHRYQSGQPFAFGCASGIPTYGCIRFNRVEGQSILSEAARNGTFDPLSPDPALNSFFNRAAFADPNAGRAPNQPFQFGTMPRVTDEVRGPKFLNEDFSIIKKTRVKEDVTVEFRTEIFNAFNRVIFRRPVTDVNAGDFGRVYGTVANPRTIQFALKVLF